MTKQLNLSEREKQQLKAMIDTGQPLPPRYRAVLFAELIWPGKTREVTNFVLPFQTIERSFGCDRGRFAIHMSCERLISCSARVESTIPQFRERLQSRDG